MAMKKRNGPGTCPRCRERPVEKLKDGYYRAACNTCRSKEPREPEYKRTFEDWLIALVPSPAESVAIEEAARQMVVWADPKTADGLLAYDILDGVCGDTRRFVKLTQCAMARAAEIRGVALSSKRNEGRDRKAEWQREKARRAA